MVKRGPERIKEKYTTKNGPARVSKEEKTRVPLIVEGHPKDYSGFPFITLIQYRKQPMLVIVDNADDDIIRAYVLDLCDPEHVDEELIINIATEWYNINRVNFPISIEFSRRGLTPMTSKIYRALNVDFVSRVIGPVPKYSMNTVKSIKRRRRKSISLAVEIHRVDHLSVE